jgi:hypothetical protein
MFLDKKCAFAGGFRKQYFYFILFLFLFFVSLYLLFECGLWSVSVSQLGFRREKHTRTRKTYGRTYLRLFLLLCNHGVFMKKKKLSLGVNVCLYFIFCPHDSIYYNNNNKIKKAQISFGKNFFLFLHFRDKTLFLLLHYTFSKSKV